MLNLEPLEGHPEHVFVRGSIADADLVASLLREHSPSVVVNFAAESHVDRSIDEPADFIETNIVGVSVLLEAIRFYLRRYSDAAPAFRFLQVSTDEVYGSIETGAFTENSPYAPNSPYAASKASADHLVRAWHRTYGIPAIVTNCSNNFGPFQFPEKLIPLMITRALREEPLPVYGDGLQVRDWLHVSDHCRALQIVIERGVPGETYLVGGEAPRRNMEVVECICARLDQVRPRSNGMSYRQLIVHVADRPAHDARYAVDSGKMRRELDWRPELGFEDALDQTVDWYLQRSDWIESVQMTYNGARLSRAI